MKFSKIIVFMLIAAVLSCMAAVPATALYDLGYYTAVELEGAQNGWASDGAGGEFELQFEDIVGAKYLYLEFENPIDTMIIIFFGDGIGWGWPQQTVEVYGTSVMYDYTALDHWEDLAAGSQIKILTTIAYQDGPGWDEIGLVSAYLLREGETPPSTAVPEPEVAPEPETAPVVIPEIIVPEPEAPVPTPAQTAAAPAPRTGDSSMIIFTLLMSAAALLFVAARRKIFN